MRFCPTCENMLYIRVEAGAGPGDEDEMQYYCRHCGEVVPADETDTKSRVAATDYADDSGTSFRAYATPYVVHDPTLPRTDGIECVRGERCSRPRDRPREVIYIKYDARDLKYLYHCTHCRTFWRSGGEVVQPRAVPQAPI